MCDPIGALTLAGTIVATCYSYGSAVADAPAEAQSLTDEASSLAGLLAGIQALSTSSASALVTLPQVLDDCQKTLQRVLDRLREHDPNGRLKRFERKKARVLWPLHRDTTRALLADVERQKSALSIALGASAVQGIDAQAILLKDVQRSVDEISDQIGTKQAAQDKAAIVGWLSSYDFALHHQQACQTYCQNTCLWMLGNPSFKKWLESRPGSLWLSGPAGSGKTILTSFVIKHLQTHCSPRNVVAYFYCNANTTQSLSTETVLSSLLSQFCVSEVPPSVINLYRQASGITGRPGPLSVEKLKATLADVIQVHASSTIVVDGIDEALEPHALCKILHSLTKVPESRLRLFLSSRPDFEVEAALADVPSLATNNSFLQKDIELYVKHRLAVDRRLAKLSDGTRSHIYQALMKRSDGMFRWAQCQLDETSRMRSESAIDVALSSLPRSLQETYQRALDKVSEYDRPYLRRAMLWLTWSLEPLELATIVDAIVLEPEMTKFDTRARLSNPEELLEICGTFAVYQEDYRHRHRAQQLRLAHHSVRDFFCDGLNQDSQFWLPAKASHRELAVLCLTYLLLPQWTNLAAKHHEAAVQEIARNRLLQYAASSWPMHVLQSDAEIELLPLINKLMSQVVNASFLFWIQVIVHCSTRMFHPNHKPQPLYYAASYGLQETVKLLISQGADINARAGGFGSTPLHAACYRRHPEIARILLAAGADPRISDNNDMTAVELTVWNETPEIAKVLLENPETAILRDEYRSAEDYKLDLRTIAEGKRLKKKVRPHGHPLRIVPRQVTELEDVATVNDTELWESFDEVVKSLNRRKQWWWDEPNT